MLTIAVHRPATLKYRWSGEQVRSIKVSNYGEIRRRHLPPADSHSAPTECWSRRTFCREIDVRSRHRFAVAATSVISCRWRTLPPLCTTKHQCDSLVLKIKVESNALAARYYSTTELALVSEDEDNEDACRPYGGAPGAKKICDPTAHAHRWAYTNADARYVCNS